MFTSSGDPSVAAGRTWTFAPVGSVQAGVHSDPFSEMLMAALDLVHGVRELILCHWLMNVESPEGSVHLGTVFFINLFL